MKDRTLLSTVHAKAGVHPGKEKIAREEIGKDMKRKDGRVKLCKPVIWRGQNFKN